DGLATGVAGAALPMLVGGILGLPIQPPVEHGLKKFLEYRLKPRTVGPAKMSAYTRVREAGADGVLRLTWKRSAAPSGACRHRTCVWRTRSRRRVRLPAG